MTEETIIKKQRYHIARLEDQLRFDKRAFEEMLLNDWVTSGQRKYYRHRIKAISDSLPSEDDLAPLWGEDEHGGFE